MERLDFRALVDDHFGGPRALYLWLCSRYDAPPKSSTVFKWYYRDSIPAAAFASIIRGKGHEEDVWWQNYLKMQAPDDTTSNQKSYTTGHTPDVFA